MDDLVGMWEMAAGMLIDDDDDEAEPDDDETDDITADEEHEDNMKTRYRIKQAEAKANAKKQSKAKNILKSAQHTLGGSSKAGEKEMKGVLKELVALMEQSFCDSAKQYKEFLCNVLTATVLEVRAWSMLHVWFCYLHVCIHGDTKDGPSGYWSV